MADWGKVEHTGDVEDRRSMTPGGLAVSGVGGLVLLLAFVFLGGKNQLLDTVLNEVAQNGSVTSQQTQTLSPQDLQYKQFVSKVLGSDNEVWLALLQEQGIAYRAPKLVLFRQATSSGCGTETTAVGPNYCPADETIYMDETFLDAIYNQFGGSKGDVAQAYIVSHEVGHHVQNLLGTMDQVNQAQQENPGDANQLSEMLELQADCYAGVWANHVQQEGIVQANEIPEAIDEASAVGDDHIQQVQTGSINPESFTHGTSAQRAQWFKTGYKTGTIAGCNTFE